MQDRNRKFFSLPWRCLRSTAAVLLSLWFHQATLFAAAPGIDSVSLVGTNVLITTTGAPGDLQFLTRNYYLPETNFTYYFINPTTKVHVMRDSVSNAPNVVLIGPVDTNGLAHFTVPIGPGVSYFQAKTVANPVIVGDGTNDIKVIAFPEDVITTNNGTATFMVVAEGTKTNALEYQWYKNGVTIPDATNSTYTITDVTLADNGSSYSCDVNMVGYSSVRVNTAKVGSPEAVIAVGTNQVPSIPVILGDGTNAIKVLAFPQDTIVTNTGQATFSVTAQGILETNLHYQWFWNEFPISSATNTSATTATLVIPNAHFDPGFTSQTNLSPNTDVAFYSCDVNMVGHPPVRVRSADTNTPGARLFLYTGTDTTIYAVYQGSGSSTCIGPYSGYVKFKSERTGTFYFPETDSSSPPHVYHSCALADLTQVAPPYQRTLWYSNAYQKSCTPPVLLPGPTASFQVVPPVLGPSDFQFSLYVLTPFPTGAQFSLQINWSP